MQIHNLLLLLSLSLTINLAYAEEDLTNQTCFSFSEKAIKYEDTNRGQVIFHISKDNYTPTVTDLACLVGIEFLKTVDDVPSKAVVGVVTKDYRIFYAIQWNLKENYFLIIESTVPKSIQLNEWSEWVGTFTKYPKPLSRLKEIISRTKLPTINTMTSIERAKFSANRVKITVSLLKKLINEEQTVDD